MADELTKFPPDIYKGLSIPKHARPLKKSVKEVVVKPIMTDEEIEASKPTSSNDAVVWELAVEWAETKLRSKNNA